MEKITNYKIVGFEIINSKTLRIIDDVNTVILHTSHTVLFAL